MGYLDESQLERMGFRRIGRGVRISEKASIYNAAGISIEDETRIDDFCILSAGSGGITLGRNVHIACYCSLIGDGPIVMEDFSGLSSRVSIYSSTDDYSGNSMTNPTVPREFCKIQSGPVVLRKHCIVGSGSVILPDVELGEGSAVGALSLVMKSCGPFEVLFGCPARKIKRRSRKILEIEQEFLRRANAAGHPGAV